MCPVSPTIQSAVRFICTLSVLTVRPELLGIGPDIIPQCITMVKFIPTKLLPRAMRCLRMPLTHFNAKKWFKDPNAVTLYYHNNMSILESSVSWSTAKKEHGANLPVYLKSTDWQNWKNTSYIMNCNNNKNNNNNDDNDWAQSAAFFFSLKQLYLLNLLRDEEWGLASAPTAFKNSHSLGRLVHVICKCVFHVAERHQSVCA